MANFDDIEQDVRVVVIQANSLVASEDLPKSRESEKRRGGVGESARER